ncbi:MAG: polyhydroxyalkanoate synthesis protein PhaF [Microlunatus sp.]|nr:polyhydroxyalkanoate synthesis protein PhaF [Microlunatus sp.]
MSDDGEARRTRRHGPTLPGYSALAEAFGAAIDGASRMTRTRAKQLAERILTSAGLDNVDLGEAASGAGAKINQLAEEIMAARKANQALLQRTITAELEKSLGRLGLARADEVAALRSEIAELRRDLAGLSRSTATTAAAKKSAAKKTTAKKSAAQKSAAKKSAAKKTAAKKSAGAGA